MSFYNLSAKDTLEKLGVNSETGLSVAEVEQSRSLHGANEFSKQKKVSIFRRIWDALREPMLILLLVAAFITLAVNIVRSSTGGEFDILECVGIFVAIMLSTVITVFMEGKSAKAFEELSKFGENIMVKVLRGGTPVLVPKKDVVVGDIVIIGTGDKVSADGRLLESVSLKSDESSLTGESMPVKKDANIVTKDPKTPVAERQNSLFCGCFITEGSGKMVVTEVGDKTEFGKIAVELANSEKTSTPLQEKLAKLGKSITILGGSAALIVFLIQLVGFLINKTANFTNISGAFIESIVLIVAAVPEGLPTIVAVSLAINVIKMSKQNALVKKMVACETVGSINIICSDKTGTLTENKMTVSFVYYDGKEVLPEKVDHERIIQNICVNSTGDIKVDCGNEFIGNPTECALLTAAFKSGVDYKKRRTSADVFEVFPFSSEEKDMTTVLCEGDKFVSYTKGSPEKIIAGCIMSEEEKQSVEYAITQFQKKSMRVLAFAHRVFENAPEKIEKEIESGMTFDGFAVITDPLRLDVKEAVERSRRAGIDLIMLTGDNIVTASAIANELQILDGGRIAVEAKDLEELSEKELLDRLKDIRVIARSTPGIKMRVVNALKSVGNVVAVTGDGINDAPAIKNADVGIAMGISGTEVSKEASDIVLLDDSYSTIVKAVEWGRGIYENFQRFIQFQLTVNLSSVIVVLVAVLAGFSSPFTAIQLLWINIIMDGPPALTLGLEPMGSDLMCRTPTQRNSGIVTRDMFLRIVTNGLYISCVFLLQYFLNFLGGSEIEKASILFTLFVVFQLFNSFNSRALNNTSVFKDLSKNKMMLGVFAATFLLQVVITQFGGGLFKTTPLSLAMWLKILAVGFSVIVVSEIVKLVHKMVAKRKN